MFRKLLAIVITVLGFSISISFAADVTVTSGDKYTPGQSKSVRVQMPEHTWIAAINSTNVEITGGEFIEIREEFPNKELVANGTKWLVYGLDNTVLEGDNLIFEIMPTNDNILTLTVSDLQAASPDGEMINVEDFTVTMTSTMDFDSDGEFDSDDVMYVFNQYLISNEFTFEFLVQFLREYVNQ